MTSSSTVWVSLCVAHILFLLCHLLWFWVIIMYLRQVSWDSRKRRDMTCFLFFRKLFFCRWILWISCHQRNGSGLGRGTNCCSRGVSPWFDARGPSRRPSYQWHCKRFKSIKDLLFWSKMLGSDSWTSARGLCKLWGATFFHHLCKLVQKYHKYVKTPQKPLFPTQSC